jgi:hypothetical protein
MSTLWKCAKRLAEVTHVKSWIAESVPAGVRRILSGVV